MRKLHKSLPCSIANSEISFNEIEKIRKDRICLSSDGMSKKKRKKAPGVSIVGNDYNPIDDRISKLPDDVLCSIIARLSMKDAISTSILSSRWRNLWTTSLKSFEFDTTTHMNMKYKKDDEALVRCVNQILAHYCGTKIESFHLQHLFLHRKHSNEIEKWIQFAIDKKVEKLKLMLSKRDLRRLDRHKHYLFPYHLFQTDQAKGSSSLKHLTLWCCTIDLPPNFNGFSSLTSMTLKDVYVSQQNVVTIFSTCLSLEWLSMSVCHLPQRLEFKSGSLQLCPLKHLCISLCYDLEEIDIRDAQKLLSFEYRGDQLSQFLCNKNATVKRLYFSTHIFYSLAAANYALGDLSTDFPRLESLFLTLPHSKANEIVINDNVPAFTDLKHLGLMFLGNHPKCLWQLTSIFLKASPRLCKLELHFPNSPARTAMKIKEEICGESYEHHNLRQVEIYNFRGDRDATQVELVQCLFNHAVAIDKIQIDRKLHVYTGNGEVLIFKPRKRIKRKLQVHKMLSQIVPSTTKLVVV